MPPVKTRALMLDGEGAPVNCGEFVRKWQQRTSDAEDPFDRFFSTSIARRFTSPSPSAAPPNTASSGVRQLFGQRQKADGCAGGRVQLIGEVAFVDEEAPAPGRCARSQWP